MIKNSLALQIGNKNSTYPVAFFICNTRFDRAIFLTSPGSPIPCSSLLNLQDHKKNREGLFHSKSTVMSFNKSDKNFLSYCDSLYFFNNGITQIKNWKQGRVEMFAHLSRYTPSSITPSNGEGGMVMVFNQIQLPLSRIPTRQNRFGKRFRKPHLLWKLQRHLENRKERIANNGRMIKGWLL